MQEDATIGEAFRANDPVAQWVVVLCMAANDMAAADRHLHDAMNEEETASPYLRMICGYLHELALHIRQGKKQPGVVKLLRGLDAQARAQEQAITQVEAELGRVRHVSFHYPKVGDQRLAEGLRAVAHYPATMTVDFERKTLRLTFADMVAEGVAFGDVPANPAPFRELVQRVHAAVGESLVPYVKAVVVAYQRDRELTIFHDA